MEKKYIKANIDEKNVTSDWIFDKDISDRISIYQKLVNLEDKDTLEEINRHKLNINFL